MNAIEIARKLAALGSAAEACQAYSLVLHEGGNPAGELEAAAYILQSGGNYRISYTAFIKLFNEGHFRAEILPLMAGTFYEPNVKQLRSRYERNCKLLKKYPYCFRKDFPSFEEDMDFSIYWDGACSADKITEYAPKGVSGFVLGTTLLFGRGRPYGEILRDIRELKF